MATQKPHVEGVRVVRGPNWDNADDADGGEGHLGTVVASPAMATTGEVHVVWDMGTTSTCRAGKDGKFDLRVFDTATVGVVHENVNCAECEQEGIYGMLWRCNSCEGSNLCSLCYASSKHDPRHQFLRIDFPGSEGKLVKKRKVSIGIRALGMFPGAMVQRGIDWKWKDQDGGPGNEGELVELKDTPNNQGKNNLAKVRWPNGKANVYRLAYQGNVDIMCVDEETGGFYFRDHLPCLDAADFVNLATIKKPSEPKNKPADAGQDAGTGAPGSESKEAATEDGKLNGDSSQDTTVTIPASQESDPQTSASLASTGGESQQEEPTQAVASPSETAAKATASTETPAAQQEESTDSTQTGTPAAAVTEGMTKSESSTFASSPALPNGDVTETPSTATLDGAKVEALVEQAMDASALSATTDREPDATLPPGGSADGPKEDTPAKSRMGGSETEVSTQDGATASASELTDTGSTAGVVPEGFSADLQGEISNTGAEACGGAAVDDSTLRVGDRAVISKPKETLRELQRGFGGVTSSMLRKIGLPGVVTRLTPPGTVGLRLGKVVFRMNPAVLTKVHKFRVGDRVRILNDLYTLNVLNERLGWNSRMDQTVGKVGEVIGIDSDEDLKVSFGHHKFAYSPACCLPAPGCPTDYITDQGSRDDNNDLMSLLGGSSLQDKLAGLFRGGGNGGGGSRRIKIGSLAELTQHLGHLTSGQGGLAGIIGGDESSEEGQLQKAIVQSDVGRVKDLCQANMSLVNKTHNGLTPMMVACHQGKRKVALTLLDLGADVNATGRKEQTALGVALDEREEDLAMLMIERGADITHANGKQRTPVHQAVFNGLNEVAQLIILMGADINLQDKYGDTPLHDAISRQNTAMVSLLLQLENININLVNRKGFTPLQLASRVKNTDIMSLLLSKDKSNIHHLKEGDFSALHTCAQHDFADGVRVLVTCGGADVNLPSGHHGLTALHVASLQGYSKVVETLLELGAKVNVEDGKGETPLHLAMGGRDTSEESREADIQTRIRISCLLISNGAFVNAENRKGRTPTVYGGMQVQAGVAQFIQQNPHLVKRKPQKSSSTLLYSSGARQSSVLSSLRDIVMPCSKCQKVCDIVLKPCGHKNICSTCASAVKTCPLCDTEVESTEPVGGHRLGSLKESQPDSESQAAGSSNIQVLIARAAEKRLESTTTGSQPSHSMDSTQPAADLSAGEDKPAPVSQSENTQEMCGASSESKHSSDVVDQADSGSQKSVTQQSSGGDSVTEDHKPSDADLSSPSEKQEEKEPSSEPKKEKDTQLDNMQAAEASSGGEETTAAKLPSGPPSFISVPENKEGPAVDLQHLSESKNGALDANVSPASDSSLTAAKSSQAAEEKKLQADDSKSNDQDVALPSASCTTPQSAGPAHPASLQQEDGGLAMDCNAKGARPKVPRTSSPPAASAPAPAPSRRPFSFDDDLVLPDIPSMPAGGGGFGDWMVMGPRGQVNLMNCKPDPRSRGAEAAAQAKPKLNPWMAVTDQRDFAGGTGVDVRMGGAGGGSEVNRKDEGRRLVAADIWGSDTGRRGEGKGRESSEGARNSSAPIGMWGDGRGMEWGRAGGGNNRPGQRGGSVSRETPSEGLAPQNPDKKGGPLNAASIWGDEKGYAAVCWDKGEEKSSSQEIWGTSHVCPTKTGAQGSPVEKKGNLPEEPSMPQKSTLAEKPLKSTSAEEPQESTLTEVPQKSVAAQEPQKSTSTEVPQKSATAEETEKEKKVTDVTSVQSQKISPSNSSSAAHGVRLRGGNETAVADGEVQGSNPTPKPVVPAAAAISKSLDMSKDSKNGLAMNQQNIKTLIGSDNLAVIFKSIPRYGDTGTGVDGDKGTQLLTLPKQVNRSLNAEMLLSATARGSKSRTSAANPTKPNASPLVASEGQQTTASGPAEKDPQAAATAAAGTQLPASGKTQALSDLKQSSGSSDTKKPEMEENLPKSQPSVPVSSEMSSKGAPPDSPASNGASSEVVSEDSLSSNSASAANPSSNGTSERQSPLNPKSAQVGITSNVHPLSASSGQNNQKGAFPCITTRSGKETMDANEFVSGDVVVIKVTRERFSEMQQEFGGTTKGMLKCLGSQKFGLVTGRTPHGSICVKFDSLAYRFNPRVLLKVHEHKVGDTVRVRDNLDLVKLLNEHVHSNSGITETLGKVGKVVKVDSQVEMSVSFGQKVVHFSPACCEPAPGAMQDTVTAGSAVQGKIINNNPSWTDGSAEKQEFMKKLARMVQEGANVSQVLGMNSDSDTSPIGCVFNAIQNDNVHVLRALCERDPFLVNKINEKQMLTPLMYASYKGSMEFVLLLLELGADINGTVIAPHIHRTPLSAAIEGKEEEIAVFLMDRGANPHMESGMRSPLHWASHYNLVQVTQVLLQRGVDPNTRDSAGDTPLIDALLARSFAVADILLGTDNVDVSITSPRGISALHVACLRNYPKAVEEILLRDTSTVNTWMDGEYTPVHLAADNDAADIVRLLGLLGEADVSVQARSRQHDGNTALHIASLRGNYNCVEALLDFGAQVNVANKELDTPLHFAMGGTSKQFDGGDVFFQEERVRVACTLISNGAFVDAENLKGRTCMRYGAPEIQAAVQNFMDQNRNLVQKKGHTGGESKPTLVLRGVQLPCAVCKGNMSDITLLPCGHKTVCGGCSGAVTLCPLCQRRVDGTTKDDQKGALFEPIT